MAEARGLLAAADEMPEIRRAGASRNSLSAEKMNQNYKRRNYDARNLYAM